MYACIHIRAHIQAVKEAEEKPELLKRHKLQDIGEKYLGQLVEAREFDQAASLCPRWLLVLLVREHNVNMDARYVYKNPVYTNAVCAYAQGCLYHVASTLLYCARCEHSSRVMVKHALKTKLVTCILCRLLKESASLWVKWIEVFSKIHQQHVIVPYIPFRNPQLKPETYNSLLLHFLVRICSSARLIFRFYYVLERICGLFYGRFFSDYCVRVSRLIASPSSRCVCCCLRVHLHSHTHTCIHTCNTYTKIFTHTHIHTYMHE